MHIEWPLYTVENILAFLEFLVQNNTSHASISSMISALKTKFAMIGVQIAPLEDKRISFFIKSLKLNRPLCPRPKPIIDVSLLQRICTICDTMYEGFVYKALYLVAFFSFLRISNLVPHSIAKYSPAIQLARANVIYAPPGALLFIKWSKTLQTKDKIKIISIPELKGSPLSPVEALKKNTSNISWGQKFAIISDFG